MAFGRTGSDHLDDDAGGTARDAGPGRRAGGGFGERGFGEHGFGEHGFGERGAGGFARSAARSGFGESGRSHGRGAPEGRARRCRGELPVTRTPNVHADASSEAGSGDASNDDGSSAPDHETLARTLCLRQLDARARTRAELATYLTRKGVPDEPANRVLDRFAEVGLIDDRALAESFVDSRRREAGLGRRALTVKLRQRGVDDAIIETVVAGIDADSELVAARDLVRRKRRSLSALEPPVQARRLVGMLARKGYPPGLAYQVVRESLAEVDLPIDTDD